MHINKPLSALYFSLHRHLHFHISFKKESRNGKENDKLIWDPAKVLQLWINSVYEWQKSGADEGKIGVSGLDYKRQ